MQVSSKVLADIPLFGKPKDPVKIIFQSDKLSNLDFFALMIKKALIGPKMKQAAAEHIHGLLLPSIKQSNVARELYKSINPTDENASVSTTAAINSFVDIEMNKCLDKLISYESNNVEIPKELSILVNENIKSKLTIELQILENLKEQKKLPKENLAEVISLLKKSELNFNDWDESNLALINNNDFREFDGTYGITSLSKYKESLDNLKIIISKNNESDYKKKIDFCIINLISKIDSAIEAINISEAEKAAKKIHRAELKNAQHQTLINKLSDLISKYSLTPELKNKKIPNEDTFNVLNNALFNNVKNETIKEYLTPMSHYLAFGEIAINKTTAPILEHLLKDEDKFISTMKDSIQRSYDKPIYKTNAHGIVLAVRKENYPNILISKLEKLEKDIKNFNSQLESEKREQLDSLTLMNASDL